MVVLFVITSTAIVAQKNSVVEALTDSIAKDSTDWCSMVKLAKYYKERSNTLRALQWAERAFAIHPSDTLKRELATCYYNRADYQRCIDLCHELLTPTEEVPVPDSSEVYLMARSFYKLENPDSALCYMMIEANRNIENQSNLVSLSKILISAKQAKAAVGYLEHYIQIDSMNMEVNTAMASAYYNAGYPRKAINEYNKLIARGDQRPSTLYYLGQSFLQTGQKEVALECFQQCNEKYQGTNGLALAMLGLVELDFDMLAVKGEEDIFTAIELMQPDPNLMFRLYFGLADYYASKDEKKTRAIDYFLKADKCKPGSEQLYYQLGYCYYMDGDVDNEYNCWDRYLQIVGEEDNSYITQGVKHRVAKIKEERFMKGEKI